MNILRTFLRVLALGLGLAMGWTAQATDPLALFQYEIVGTRLAVSPSAVSVPKGIPGSVLVEVVGNTALAQGAYVEAILRGPSFPARRLLGRPGEALVLPPLPLVGSYRLDAIRLVDSATGEVRLEGTPGSVPITVFDEVLVTRVETRPLSLDEIREKGIAIDENNFRAVEFEVGFVLDGETIPVRFPVVAPRFVQTTEIIPAAELEARLAEAAAFNRQLASLTELPEELLGAELNIELQGVNFQVVDPSEDDLALRIPPIPALLMIPGNIGYLNQFFSVQVFTENGSPAGSGLNVINVQAELVLPKGPDQVAAASYSEPGDDPLRFARVGPDAVIESTQSVVGPGGDGKLGTADDNPRLAPREEGQAEFLVEGLQEGLHIMDLDLTADLEGLAAGVVRVKGKAAGAVLVRNPKFSMAFTHPRTVRAGEPYEASVTLLNTGSTEANLVSVSLSAASLSGGVLESEESVDMGTIRPGGSATARFRIRAQRTGEVTFSNLTTGEDAVAGRFQLSMGIDERGVALSPDTLLLPDYVDELPEGIRTAATRVLGQALSIATAPQLPADVLPVTRQLVKARAVELAEAGQRIRYGDSLPQVLLDLVVDWQGARNFSEGFDQLLRETDAGLEWRDAVALALSAADGATPVARLGAVAADLAGRGETHTVVADSLPPGDADFEVTIDDGVVESALSTVEQALVYDHTDGRWFARVGSATGVATWRLRNPVATGGISLGRFLPTGTGTRDQWTLPALAAGAVLTLDVSAEPPVLAIDDEGDGTVDRSLAADARESVTERAPAVVAVIQDMAVEAGRPLKRCPVPELANYGTVVAVLFNKPMSQEAVDVPEAYVLDNGNVAYAVQIQPGSRVALLSLRQPVGGLVERTLTLSGIEDSRGNALGVNTAPVQTDFAEGVRIQGRAVRADGSPAAGIPVTLTYFDESENELLGSCDVVVVRTSQVTTDDSGGFSFDMVLAGIQYVISATDTFGLSEEAVALIVSGATEQDQLRSRLLEIAAGNPNSLLAAFAVASLPEAVAAAEGLDRAVLRDRVDEDSPRVGSTVPVALRFRGRAAVEGTVLLSDGTTPASGAAVNLFPDPTSRELGRGVFADGLGRFTFFGVPLGNFTVKADTIGGLTRTIAGAVSEPGTTNTISVVLSSTNAPRVAFRGTVLESDGVTPHGGASVYMGRLDGDRMFDIVAAVTADAAGSWVAEDVPARTYDFLAISTDNQRTAKRPQVEAVSGTTTVHLTLTGTAVVVGRVETSAGRPVENALVAGGETLVRTDVNGAFRLTGVPVGERTISAGVERDADAGWDFPRIGSGRLTVLPGEESFVVIRLREAGRITGRVLDADGVAVPNARVAIPQESGFQWVNADSTGRYAFEGMPLDAYTLSAPAPPAVEKDTQGLVDQLEDNPTEDQIEAIIAEAYALFTGASDPFLNGEGASFDPEGWGYVETALTFDGETAVADIRFLPKGTVSGTVVNGQSVPIGAAVRLTGVAPQANGAPGFRVRGDVNSDPATGYFEFGDALFTGNWGLQAASPFFPTVITTSGNTTSTERDVAGVVLQFPPTREVNGRLAGIVYQPDGVTPVGEGVRVQISFGDDYIITTEEGGVYDTRANLPATDAGGRPGVVYTLRAEDPSTGYRGESVVRLLPGVTNQSSVTLIAKGGLVVTVLQADGSPADGATVDVRQGSYPQDRSDGVAGVDGTVTFGNLFAGSYAVSAQMLSGPTRIYGRASVQVTAGEVAAVTVVLQPTASIAGRYLKRDLVTPVSFAQIAVGNVGFTTSDEEGVFTVTGLPLGTYRITSSDPVTGRGAQTTVTLSTSGATNEVSLVEQSLGSIEGVVINSQRTGGASGATVLLSVDDGLSSPQAVTTGPDGTFSFPSVAAGNYRIVASDALTGLSAQVTGTLAEDVTLVTVEIVLPAVATVEVAVVDPDGVTPAGNTRVTLSLAGVETISDTDDAGLVTFSDLPLGTYSVVAQSLAVTNSSSVASGSVTLATAGSTHAVVLVLSGTGIVRGTVVDSDGVTPVPGVVVSLTVQDGVLARNEESTLTDGVGGFEFLNVPLAALRLTAVDEALTGSESMTLASHGDVAEVTLVLGDSGTVVGRLLRADGVTPVRNEEVVITFESQSGLPGRDFTTSDSLGRFEFGSIPLGAFTLSTVAVAFDGIAGGGGTLAVNGETVDVGDLVLDEDDPRVVEVEPVDGASEVSTATVVTLDFNEALDPDTVRDDGIFLRTAAGQAVDATVALQAHPDDGVLRRVVLTPEAPLASETTHQIVVIDGERQDALGGVTGVGPSDRVGRILVAPFLATFTTRDDDPPGLLSVFPAQGEVQVDVRSVIRLTFDEAMDPTSVTLGMTGPGGAVEGTLTTVLGDTVFLFTPTAALSPNATYTISGAGFRDVAGNAATGDPFTFTFATLDTLGPVVASLALADGALPISGSAVELEAVLATSEAGASVRFSADLVVLGTDTASPFRWPLTLPSMGSVVYRATAIDAYGNEGESVEYALTVVDGTDPELTLMSPAESAVLDPEAPLVLAYRVADNSFGVSLTATLSGVVEATDSVEVVLTPGVVSEGSFSFSLTGVPLGGGEVEVVLTAVDVAGNASSVTRTFQIPDREPPQLVSVIPADGSTTVSPWLDSIVLTFSEAMDPATVDTNRLQFFAGAEVRPLNITLSEDGRTATLAWDGLLEQGTGHTNRILPGMTDRAGNALVLEDGTAWPEAGSNAVFTTASMIVVSPLAGDPVIPGMSVGAQVTIGSGYGADTVRFLLNDGDAQDVAVADLDTEASVTWTLPADSTVAVVRIQALRAGRDSIEFEPIVLGFQPSEGDADGDGWLNGYEFSRGMDPFVADGADDDFDGDGLSNGGELALGGDPADPDTDDDGLADGSELALGTGLTDPDSDDDTLLDGVDPEPLFSALGIDFVGVESVRIREGQQTNLLFVVESRVGPVALVDFVRTEAVPGYVGFNGLSVTNTATNGVVQVQLRLLPLHDAAGTNRLVLLAGTASGVTNTHIIEVVIEDDPMLQTTTWVGGSGAWSDAAHWSDGVPDFDHIAVIDSVGTAEITLDVVPSARALLMDSSDAVLKPGLNLTSTVPMEVRLGVVALDNNREMVLAAPAVIAGTVRLASQSTGSRLSAFGAVNLRGRLEVTGDAPLMGGTARVGGRWFLEQSSLVDLAPDARMALVGGTQWIQAGGMVLDAASRFDVSLTDPAMHRMALGSAVTGEGVFAVEGPALLQVYGDVPVASEVRVGLMGRVQGQGRLVLRGPHRLEGQFDAGVVAAGSSSGTINNALFREPVTLSETANWAVNGARFDDGIHVGPGAVLSASVGWSLRIGAASTNEGRILLGAGSAGSILEGTGTLVNLGRIEVVMLPVDLGTPARLALPILVAPGGVFEIGTGASVSMDQGAGLTVEGQLQVAGTLRLENRTPAPALTIADGGAVDGSGTVQVDGANVVTVDGSWGSGVALRGSSTGSFVGSGSLVLATNSLLAGTFQIPVTLDAGAGGTAEAAVFDGGLIVKSGAGLTLRGVRLAHGSRVEAGGNVTVMGGTTLTLDGVLEVDGLLALTSQGVGSTLAGAGEVQVDGLVEVNSTPPAFGIPAVLGVPIQVNTTGRLRVLEGALASVPAGGRVSASGLVDLRPTGSLDLAAGTPAPTLTVMTFGQIFGGGRLGLNGESRFTLHGQWDPTLTLGTAAGTVVNGSGTLRLGGTQSLLGTFQLPVTVEAGGVVGMSTASVEQALTVESGASLTVSGSLTTASDVWLKPGATAEVGGGVFWTLQGAVTNQGQLRLNSQASGSVLTGEGTLHQLGAVTVAATAPLFGVGASVRVPVVTAFGASWTLDPDAILLLEDGATDVAMGGPLTLGAGSVLRLTPEGSGRRLSFENGASVSGTGTLELSGPHTVVIASPLTVTDSEVLANNTGGFLGLGSLTLLGSSELRVMVSLGLPAGLTVGGVLTVDPPVVLQIPGTLTLQSGGTIDNLGAIETVEYVDLGGTYTGTLPVVTGGGAPMAFLIDGIELGGVATPSGRSASGGADPGRQVRLFWTAPTDGPFLVEVTSDFVNWQIVTTQSAAVGGRRYRAIVPAPGSNQSFYRVRRWGEGR